MFTKRMPLRIMNEPKGYFVPPATSDAVPPMPSPFNVRQSVPLSNGLAHSDSTYPWWRLVVPVNRNLVSVRARRGFLFTWGFGYAARDDFDPVDRELQLTTSALEPGLPLVVINGQVVTVRHTILYAANKLGGVH
jgi:hypothetical protein